MKTYIKFILGCMFLVSITQCSLMKTRNRLATSAASEERLVLQESIMHQQRIVMKRAVLDSSEAAYTVVIYPADSFQFSLQDGFKGRAMKVEVSGSIRQKRLVQDSMNVTNVAATDREVASAVKTKSTFSKDDKVVERTPINWHWIIWTGIAVLVGWVLWKSLLRRYI